MALWNDKRTPAGHVTDTRTGHTGPLASHAGHYTDGSHRALGDTPQPQGLASAAQPRGFGPTPWNSAAAHKEHFDTYVRAQNFAGDVKQRQEFKAKSSLKRAALKVTGRAPKPRTPGLKLK